MSQVNRGRDVLDLMTKKGELGMREAIVRLAEDNTMLHHELKDTREVVTKILQQIALTMQVMKDHQNVMAKIQEKYYPNNDANPDKPWSK